MNRNFGSLVGRQNLLTANSAVETAVQRLSSGARVNSADMASEASRLVKQQILAGAASEMISLALAQKRSLIDMLI